MASIRTHYKIILMIAVLITVPILLSVLATQYESCKWFWRNCTSGISHDYINPNELSNQLLGPVVCWDNAALYKDINTGTCYGPSGPISTPPPSNAKIVRIGSGDEGRK